MRPQRWSVWGQNLSLQSPPCRKHRDTCLFTGSRNPRGGGEWETHGAWMMLISTAGAPGLWQQRAVNCRLWASETFPVSRGPSWHPLCRDVGSQPAPQQWCSHYSPAGCDSHPAIGQPEKVLVRRMMACSSSQGGQLASPEEESSALCRWPLSPGCCLSWRWNSSMGSWSCRGISQQVVQISSSLRAAWAAPSLGERCGNLSAEGLGDEGPGHSGHLCLLAFCPLNSDTHYLESKAKGRSLALSASQGQGTEVMLGPGVLSAGGKEAVMPWSQWLLSSEWGGSWRSVLLPPLWSGRKFNSCLVLAFVFPISICVQPSSRSLLVCVGVFFLTLSWAHSSPVGLGGTPGRESLWISTCFCVWSVSMSPCRTVAALQVLQGVNAIMGVYCCPWGSLCRVCGFCFSLFFAF